MSPGNAVAIDSSTATPAARATAHPLGAWLTPRGAGFALYSSTARRCWVSLYDPAGQPLFRGELVPEGDGRFAVELDGVGPDVLYKFILDERELPDPWARELPFGVHGPAGLAVSRHAWRNHRVRRDSYVFYELHVGTFTPEGTFAAARARLPYLAELGVTAIELMPIAAFAGTRGWGYDGVAMFAPFAPYGRPDEVRAFVDEARGLGLAVILDVVYNHFGPAGNYLPAYCPDFFRQDLHNAWGQAPNFAHPVLRRQILRNASYWLTEFGFDGLRLDAVHAITDPSPRHIVHELVEQVRRAVPGAILVAEDERNHPALVTQLGLDSIWADDFHHAVRVTLTGERDGYYRAYTPGIATVAETVQEGWLYRGQHYAPLGKPRGQAAKDLAAEAFVYCIQNHDQVGNRALGDRLSDVIPPEAYAAASALLLFLPMTPLLFMGQEWAARSPFQFFTDHEPELGRLITEGRRREFQSFALFASASAQATGTSEGNVVPDPQDVATFERSRLRWHELDEPPHADTLALYRQLLRLRREDPVLAQAGRRELSLASAGEVLAVRRWHGANTRTLLLNFGSRPIARATLHERGLIDGACQLVLATTALSADLQELPGYGAVIVANG